MLSGGRLKSVCRYHVLSLRLSRLKSVYLPMFLLAILTPATATSCQFPCNPSTQCRNIDISSCQHGTVKDVCECCFVCGKGPGEYCGSYGKCGDGLICVQGFEEGLSEEDLRTYPSICQPAPTTRTSIEGLTTTSRETDTPTTRESATTTKSPSPTPVTHPQTSNCTNSSGNSLPNDQASGADLPETCREGCSVTFCADKARICSAVGHEYKKVAQRNLCQHTSCHSCFLLVKPNCDHFRCPEPPNKKCLREYYQCIRDHLFDRQLSTAPIMLRLDDPRAQSVNGEVVCHIPEVDETTGVGAR